MKNWLSCFFVFLSVLGFYVSLCGETQGANSYERSFKPISNANTEARILVNVDVDRKDRVYEEGEFMTVSVTSSHSGYLYFIYQDVEGQVLMLFPNKYDHNNRIEAEKKIVIPNQSSAFDLQATPPFGKEKFLVLVSTKPISSIEKMPFDSGSFKRFNDRDITTTSSELKGFNVVERKHAWGENLIDITVVPRNGRSVSKPERVLVAVCVSEYTDSNINPLPACRKDFDSIISYLQSKGGITEENTYTLLDNQVTLENVKELFCETLPEKVKPGSEIIIYWTGHGSTFSNTDVDTEGSYRQTLIMYDSKPSKPETQLQDQVFGRWVQSLSGRKLLFIIDSCFSSGMASHAKGFGNRQGNMRWNFGFKPLACFKDIGQNETALICSSASDQQSLVMMDRSMSVMTYYLLDAMKNKKPINHREIVDIIKPKVADYVGDTYDVQQKVMFQDDLSSPLVLNPQ